MTGLDLETFLRLIRADLGAWASLGAIALILALMTWTSRGSRRALRKCLVLSVIVHVSAVAYGGRLPLAIVRVPPRPPEPERERIRQVRVTPEVEAADGSKGVLSPDGRPRRRLADW